MEHELRKEPFQKPWESLLTTSPRRAMRNSLTRREVDAGTKIQSQPNTGGNNRMFSLPSRVQPQFARIDTTVPYVARVHGSMYQRRGEPQRGPASMHDVIPQTHRPFNCFQLNRYSFINSSLRPAGAEEKSLRPIGFAVPWSGCRLEIERQMAKANPHLLLRRPDRYQLFVSPICIAGRGILGGGNGQ